MIAMDTFADELVKLSSNMARQSLAPLVSQGKSTGMQFPTIEEAAKAVLRRQIKPNDVVTVAGKATSVSREMVNNSLPINMRVDQRQVLPPHELSSDTTSKVSELMTRTDPNRYIVPLRRMDMLSRQMRR